MSPGGWCLQEGRLQCSFRLPPGSDSRSLTIHARINAHSQCNSMYLSHSQMGSDVYTHLVIFFFFYCRKCPFSEYNLYKKREQKLLGGKKISEQVRDLLQVIRPAERRAKACILGVPMAQQVKNQIRSVPGLAQWVKYLARHCHRLQCRAQMRLISGVAVAVAQASSCTSNSTPSLGTSICCRCGPNKKISK